MKSITIITNDRELADNLFSPKMTKDERRASRIRNRDRKQPAKTDAFAECEDDVAMPVCSQREDNLKPGLCEIAGLVRRARTEVLEGNADHALITLGRISNAVESELNK